MKKSVSLYVLLMVSLGVFLSHVSVREKDNGYVMVVDEREIDALGMAHEGWVQLKRNCTRIATHSASSPLAEPIVRVVRSYSPPHSSTAHMVGLWSTDGWAMAEFAFDNLLPAVVLFKLKDGQPEIVPNAVWSGDTRPWVAAPLIRRYLLEKEPQAPADLLNCFGPLSHFQN